MLILSFNVDHVTAGLRLSSEQPVAWRRTAPLAGVFADHTPKVEHLAAQLPIETSAIVTELFSSWRSTFRTSYVVSPRLTVTPSLRTAAELSSSVRSSVSDDRRLSSEISPQMGSPVVTGLFRFLPSLQRSLAVAFVGKALPSDVKSGLSVASSQSVPRRPHHRLRQASN